MFCCRSCRKADEEKPLLDDNYEPTVLTVESADPQEGTQKDVAGESASSELLTEAEEAFFRIKYSVDPEAVNRSIESCTPFKENIVDLLVEMIVEKSYDSNPSTVFNAGIQFYMKHDPEILEDSLFLFALIFSYRRFRRMIILLEKISSPDMEPLRVRIEEIIDELMKKVDFGLRHERKRVLNGLTDFIAETKNRKLMSEVINSNPQSRSSYSFVRRKS